MVCQGCGHPVENEVRFCTKCGAQVSGPQVMGAPVMGPPPMGQGAGYAVPPMYALQPMRMPRVERNLQTLGVLWCIYGAYRLLMGMVGMFFLRAFSLGRFGDGNWPIHRGLEAFGPGFMGALLPFVAGITVLAAGLAFVLGFALLTRKPWGRVLGIVVAVLALLKFPIGTGLGIYTLWVLAPSQSGMEYEAIADRS